MQKKTKRLKRTIKEYKTLVKVIQKENERYKEQTSKFEDVIAKLKRSKKKARNLTFSWLKKFKFQKIKVKALRTKIKALEVYSSSSGTKLNILANAITFC